MLIGRTVSSLLLALEHVIDEFSWDLNNKLVVFENLCFTSLWKESKQKKLIIDVLNNEQKYSSKQPEYLSNR